MKLNEVTMSDFKAVLSAMPKQPQRQDATNDQLRDLKMVANKLGMYDAADVIQNILDRIKKENRNVN